MEQTNNYSLPRETRRHRMVRHLGEQFGRQGRIVYRQVLRGAAYSLGSGAVSLIVVWFEARH